MAGWHHRLDGHEFEKTPGDSEGQRSMATEVCLVKAMAFPVVMYGCGS